MNGCFAVYGGSVCGRDHRRAGRNNQDAFSWYQDRHSTVAVVTDGCGSTRTSELGAQLIARLIVRSVARNAYFAPGRAQRDAKTTFRLLLERVRAEVLAHLMVLGHAMDESYREVAYNHFLATAVGCAVLPWGAGIFSVGDGVFAYNGEISVLHSAEGNRPAYLAYALTDERLWNFRPDDESEFRIHRVAKPEEISAILIGTDGVADLLRAEGESVPGASQRVGPLSQFWKDECFAKNSDMVRRRLTLIGRDVGWGASMQAGLLRDDTTLVVVRRLAGGE